MKNILFVMQSLSSGGAEKSLVNLLSLLPRDQYNIDVLLFRRNGVFLSQVPDWVNVLETPDDLRKLYAPVTQSGGQIFTKVVGTVASRLKEHEIRLAEAYRWRHFYKKNIKCIPQKYDVAIAYISGEVMYFLGDKIDADRKLVWIHNDYRTAGHPKKYDYDYFKNVDAIVSISERCVDILKEEFPEFREKVFCIENITSPSIIQKKAEEFWPKEFSYDTCRLLSIGRLSNQKGFDMAIDAAAILKERGLKFQWYVVGAGSLKSTLEKQIQRKDVVDCFQLLGVRENPYVYIKNCDIVVQPSRYEGKSVVLDETKILGRPIVATAYPTVRDQIEDGKEGLIVPMNPEGIADGIERMIIDRSFRQQIEQFLDNHEYGNEDEVQKYIELIS